MELNPHAAIELPLRIVLWEADGIAFLAYRDVENTLASEFNIPEPMTSPFGKIRALLARVTGHAQAPIQA
jgi:hypothetical protein